MNFFEKYGPSARDCYHSCEADSLEIYESHVRNRVNKMGWGLITELLIRHPAETEEKEGSHRVVLVEPQLHNRALPRATIVTKTICQLLWDRDSKEQWQNHYHLFKTLHAEPNAKGFWGTIFEPGFHQLCVRGAKFNIFPMTESRRERPRNYKFTNDQLDNPETLTLDKPKQIYFDRDNPIDSLLDGHYYRPRALNNPSFDSFVYNTCSRRISAFQVTVAEEHGLASRGVYALRDLGETLQINGLKIRFIVVVFGDSKVTFTVDKKLYDDLGLEVWALGLTEKEIYPQLFLSP